MFKYKESKIVLPVLMGLVLIVTVLAYKSAQKDILRDDILIRNGIVISGIVVDYKISNNHDFGILQLKVTDSNSSSFNYKSDDFLYPYKIKDSVAEIYTHISTIQKGFKIALNSNEKTIKIYNDNDFLQELEIAMIYEETDMNFVRKNTIFK